MQPKRFGEAEFPFGSTHAPGSDFLKRANAFFAKAYYAHTPTGVTDSASIKATQWGQVRAGALCLACSSCWVEFLRSHYWLALCVCLCLQAETDFTDADFDKYSRRVYLVFSNAVHAVLARLIAVRGKAEGALDGVVVVVLPVGDTIADPDAGGATDAGAAYVEIYQQLSSLFELNDEEGRVPAPSNLYPVIKVIF